MIHGWIAPRTASHCTAGGGGGGSCGGGGCLDLMGLNDCLADDAGGFDAHVQF
jgi:hypothetical protein